MTRTPTAEEVLGLYLELQRALESDQIPHPDDTWKARQNRLSAARYRFNDAWKQWQAAQGPVTREWFEERFGDEYAMGKDVMGNDWVVSCPDADGKMYLETEDEHAAVTVTLKVETRSDIETLVRVLGGTQ